jgi:predicted RNase H-like nuclease (RuvC/YqgF family)
MLSLAQGGVKLHRRVANSTVRYTKMAATRSLQELQAEIRELKAQVKELELENEELSDRLDQIQSLADTEGEEDEEEEPGAVEEVGEGEGEQEDEEPYSDDEGGVAYIEQD